MKTPSGGKTSQCSQGYREGLCVVAVEQGLHKRGGYSSSRKNEKILLPINPLWQDFETKKIGPKSQQHQGERIKSKTKTNRQEARVNLVRLSMWTFPSLRQKSLRYRHVRDQRIAGEGPQAPVYRLSRSVKTVSEALQEWRFGVHDRPAIQDLNRQYGRKNGEYQQRTLNTQVKSGRSESIGIWSLRWITRMRWQFGLWRS
jgi:hypothetical protein